MLCVANLGWFRLFRQWECLKCNGHVLLVLYVRRPSKQARLFLNHICIWNRKVAFIQDVDADLDKIATHPPLPSILSLEFSSKIIGIFLKSRTSIGCFSSLSSSFVSTQNILISESGTNSSHMYNLAKSQSYRRLKLLLENTKFMNLINSRLIYHRYQRKLKHACD